MEEKNFQEWFEKGFLPAVQHLPENGPVILFFDGHSSHLALSMIVKARGAGVDLFTLPSNTSHILQPLDVAVYGPMKTAWKEILQDCKLKTRASKADKKVFASLLSELFKHAITPAQLKAGFRTTGICPFNPIDQKLATSIPFSTTKQLPQSTSVQPAETPIRTHLTSYFTDLLKPKQPEDMGKKCRQRVRPAYYGEALTKDEVFEQIQVLMKKERRRRELGGRGKGGERHKIINRMRVNKVHVHKYLQIKVCG